MSKLPFYKKIGFKLTIIPVCALLIVGTITVTYMSKTNGNLIQQINTERSQKSLSTLEAVLEEYRSTSKMAAESLAQDAGIIQAIEAGDAAAARAAAKNVVEQKLLQVAFVTITDDGGNVIARTHSDKVGDSIAKQKNVSLALQGQITTHTDVGTEIKLSIRTGAPVKNASGRIIGVVSTGVSLVDPSFVDRLKEMTGSEFTVFIGDERANTTIIQNGERVIGTKLDPKIANIVINERTAYTGEAKILGNPYATAYQPILSTDGETIGVFFAGVPIAAINTAREFAVINSVIIEIALVAVMVIALMVFVRNIIAKPVAGMSVVAGEMASGNLNQQMHAKSKDELGILADSLNDMVTSLKGYVLDITEKLGLIAKGDMRVQVDREYIGDFAAIKRAMQDTVAALNQTLLTINTAAEQVSTGSSQVASGAQALATGSTEQASAVEQLSVSITKVAEQAAGNSANVKVASQYVQQAAEGVNAGNEHMGQLTKAMANIDSASSQITNITKVIEDIAFQTNILALNAAIEAARAGNAGKGFAVVADEVRNLAGKSAEAAKKTAELIRRSTATVAEGTQIAEQTAQILRVVQEKAEMVYQSIIKIDSASNDQAVAIEQIKQGLAQVSAVVQTNAATAEENSATSEEMSAQAATLREEVNKFKLDSAHGEYNRRSISL